MALPKVLGTMPDRSHTCTKEVRELRGELRKKTQLHEISKLGTSIE